MDTSKIPEDILKQVCYSSRELERKRSFMHEYFNRLYNRNDLAEVTRLLDPLFNTQQDYKVHEGIDFVNELVRKDDSIIKDALPGYNKTAEIVSIHYFNKVASKPIDAKRKIIDTAYKAASVVNSEKRLGVFITALGSISSIGDHDEFVNLIHEYNSYGNLVDGKQKELALTDLDILSKYIDYSRNNIYMLYEDSFPVGVTENMLYSPKVLSQLNVRSR